jgi:hypothetical protein
LQGTLVVVVGLTDGTVVVVVAVVDDVLVESATVVVEVACPRGPEWQWFASP